MVKKICIICLVLGVLLFSLLASSCVTAERYRLDEGTYICEYGSFYGELEIEEITEREYEDKYRRNCLRTNYGKKYKYYSAVLYIIDKDTNQKLYLDLNYMELGKIDKTTAAQYYFSGDEVTITPSKDCMNISYSSNSISFTYNFYRKKDK